MKKRENHKKKFFCRFDQEKVFHVIFSDFHEKSLKNRIKIIRILN
jgi:hypothetical protein